MFALKTEKEMVLTRERSEREHSGKNANAMGGRYVLTADQPCSDCFGSFGTLDSEQGEPCGVSGATSPGAHACLCISRDWPGFWSPAGEKALLTAVWGLPFRAWAPPGGRASAFPAPGAAPRGGACGQRPAAQPRLHREPAGCLSERRPKSSGRRRGCRALSGDTVLSGVTRNPLRSRIPWGLALHPAPSLRGSPVTRPPPAHYAFLFLPKEGCREAKRRRLTFRTTRSSAKWRGPAQGGGRFQVLS